MSIIVQMNEKQTWEEIEYGKGEAGDYLMCERSEGSPMIATHGKKVVIIVCPKCLKPGSCTNHRVIQEKPLTIRASFLCGQKVHGGQCGFHAMIDDGVMREC